MSKKTVAPATPEYLAKTHLSEFNELYRENIQDFYATKEMSVSALDEKLGTLETFYTDKVSRFQFSWITKNGSVFQSKDQNKQQKIIQERNEIFDSVQKSVHAFEVFNVSHMAQSIPFKKKIDLIAEEKRYIIKDFTEEANKNPKLKKLYDTAIENITAIEDRYVREASLQRGLQLVKQFTSSVQKIVAGNDNNHDKSNVLREAYKEVSKQIDAIPDSYGKEKFLNACKNIYFEQDDKLDSRQAPQKQSSKQIIEGFSIFANAIVENKQITYNDKFSLLKGKFDATRKELETMFPKESKAGKEEFEKAFTQVSMIMAEKLNNLLPSNIKKEKPAPASLCVRFCGLFSTNRNSAEGSKPQPSVTTASTLKR